MPGLTRATAAARIGMLTELMATASGAMWRRGFEDGLRGCGLPVRGYAGVPPIPARRCISATPGDDASLHLPDARRKIVDLHDRRGECLAGDLWNVCCLVLKRCHQLRQTLDALSAIAAC
jgi:hypothetical protein